MKKEINFIIKTLDQLGKALADHQHKWSNTERDNFEKSITLLKKIK